MNKYILSLILLAAIGCQSETSTKEEVVEDTSAENIIQLSELQQQTIGLKMDTVGIVNIPTTKQLNGFVDVPPEKKITLSAPIGGFVDQLTVLNGMKVKMGQFLLSLKDQSFIQLQEQYLSTYHQWKVDEANYKRQEALSAEKINSMKSLEQARATYEASSVMLSGMRERLRMMNVNINSLEAGNINPIYRMYAPIDGYITSISVNKGKYVSNAEALLDIVDLSAAYAVINVFEKDLAFVKLGQNVSIQLSDGVSVLPAKVKYIGRAINEDRSITVIAEFAEKSDKIIPGMYLTAFVELSNHELLGVPNNAIVNYQMEKYVFVATEDAYSFAPVKITTKETNQQFTGIENNEQLNRGTSIVVVGAYDLLSKWKNKEEEE